MKLYLKPEINCSSPEEFLQDYLVGRPSTYDEEGELQCESCCNRSITDLYYLTKTYFPEVTLNKVVKILSDICINSDFKHVILFCSDINKIVVYKRIHAGYDFSYYDKDYAKFGMVSYNATNKGNDGYSMNDYYKML